MMAKNRHRPDRWIVGLTLSLTCYSLIGITTAHAMTDQGLDDQDISNVSVPSVFVRSNGVNPTTVEKMALPPKWSGRLTSEEYPVPRIKSWKMEPFAMVPVRPELGITVAKELARDPSQAASKSYTFLQKKIDENISGKITVANLESLAWSACKTMVDHLRIVKKMSNENIFKVDRKIPLHWTFGGHLRTTHLSSSPAEVNDPTGNPKVKSYIVCKHYGGPVVNPGVKPGASGLATDLGKFGLYEMKTIPTRNMANMNEYCPAHIGLGTIVYANQKGVLSTYVEYRDSHGKITKGPKRSINTGQMNPNDGRVVTEFLDNISLPVFKRVPPKPKGSGFGGSIGGFKAEKNDTDGGFLPGGDNENIHQGEVRVVVKTGQPVQVSPGGQQADGGVKGALASDWLPYKLTCKAKVNPGLGGMPQGMTGGAHPTHSNNEPASTDLASPPNQRRPARLVRTYVDVVIRDARLRLRRLQVTVANQGTADAQGCAVDINYQAGGQNRNSTMRLGNIAAGDSVTETTRLAGVTPHNVQLKVNCANEPAGRTGNNSRNL